MRLLALVPLFLTLVLVDPVLVNKAWLKLTSAVQDVQDPAYSLRVRILTRNASRTSYSAMRMWGRADLSSTAGTGFDTSLRATSF